MSDLVWMFLAGWLFRSLLGWQRSPNATDFTTGAAKALTVIFVMVCLWQGCSDGTS